jgi:hypothetical protein
LCLTLLYFSAEERIDDRANYRLPAMQDAD